MQKRSRITGGIVAVWGLVALFSSLSKPRVAALHGSDILGLIAVGLCFGVGFVGLIGKLRIGE